MAYLLMQALSAAIIAFAGLYLRSRYSIRPDAVYRKALVQLNTNPAILEVHVPAWCTQNVSQSCTQPLTADARPAPPLSVPAMQALHICYVMPASAILGVLSSTFCILLYHAAETQPHEA